MVNCHSNFLKALELVPKLVELAEIFGNHSNAAIIDLDPNFSYLLQCIP